MVFTASVCKHKKMLSLVTSACKQGKVSCKCPSCAQFCSYHNACCNIADCIICRVHLEEASQATSFAYILAMFVFTHARNVATRRSQAPQQQFDIEPSQQDFDTVPSRGNIHDKTLAYNIAQVKKPLHAQCSCQHERWDLTNGKLISTCELAGVTTASTLPILATAASS